MERIEFLFNALNATRHPNVLDVGANPLDKPPYSDLVDELVEQEIKGQNKILHPVVVVSHLPILWPSAWLVERVFWLKIKMNFVHFRLLSWISLLIGLEMNCAITYAPLKAN